ncbi:MAG: sigma-70 family RNA polymerase sigma factor [Cyclobacteriaceae bacterium]|nr:sigma-70 family RNA polymerase sigma factor [Cyclobacteriaceae bacterium]
MRKFAKYTEPLAYKSKITGTDINPSVADVENYNHSAVGDNELQKLPDLEVWKRFRNGDEAAFTFIYYNHFASLCRYGSQFIRQKELVKDHIHDLFIELSDQRRKLSDTNSIKFYLMKSLKNRMLAAKTKSPAFSEEETDFNGYNFEITFSIEHNIIKDQAIEERNQKLNAAIQKLSKRQREIIYYYYFEDLSLEEIMQLMDSGNVKSLQNLLYRAIHQLREYVNIKLAMLIFGFYLYL